MPKRNKGEKLERYLQKIRKIEEKMIRRHGRRRHYSDSSASSSQDVDYEMLAPQRDVESPLSVEQSLLDLPAQPAPILEHQAPPPPAEPAKMDQAGSETTLATEVLLALGDPIPDKAKFGPKMNNEVAHIWTAILKDGLQKESKQKLVEQHLAPENCPLLLAPKLNPEIISSVSESIINRDKRVESEQNQLGIGLSAVSKALTELINNENVDRLKMISMLSDAGRIFADLHSSLTKSRKALIFPALDKTFIDAVKSIDRDEFLYGPNLGERIKNLKSCQRTGQSIKKPLANRQGNLNGPPRNQRATARYGHKKTLPPAQPRKHYNPQYQPNTKKGKAPREKPPARA